MKLTDIYKKGLRSLSLISNSELLSMLTDSTGTGNLVFSDNPELTGTPTAPTPTTESGLATKGYVDTHLDNNLIINGAMEVSQANGDNPVTGSSFYPADMFIQSYSASLAGTPSTIQRKSRADDSTLPEGFDKYIEIIPPASPPAIASDHYTEVAYAIEGRDLKHLGIGSATPETMTLSFWCKTESARTYSVAFRNGVFYNRSYVTEFSTSGSGWERITITIPLDSGSTSWNLDNQSGLQIDWALRVGSTFHTTATDTWVDGTYLGTSTQDDFLDSSSNTFAITGVDFRRGTSAPEKFIHRTYQEELLRCYRYVFRETQGSDNPQPSYAYRYSTATNYGFNYTRLPVEFRIPPQDASKSYTLSNTEVNPNQYHKADTLQFHKDAQGGGITDLIIFGTMI